MDQEVKKNVVNAKLSLRKRCPSKSDANMNGTGSCMSMEAQKEGHQCYCYKQKSFLLQEQVKLIRWWA